MYIKTSDTTIVSKLKENLGKIIVFHYCCSECEDTQVTYGNLVDDDLINYIIANDCIFLGYECTSCGVRHTKVETEEIYGIEIL